MSEIADIAKGKWREILKSCGLADGFLVGKHCACPICGGKDRFRFDDKEGRGTWFCNQCGSGDGFKLIMKLLGLDFKECAKIVKERAGHYETEKPKQEKTVEQNKASLRELWKQSEAVTPGDFVDKYLLARGLYGRSKALRKIYKCRSSEGVLYPAMLAVVSAADGSPATLHRTYIHEGKKANIKCPREFMPGKIPEGSAVRLAEATVNLGIAEGIETALSAAQIFKIPVWAALNATLLEKWTPPAESTNIFIFGDNDSSYAGQKATYCLASRLCAKGLSVQVMISATQGFDWNDELLRQGAVA